MEKTIENKNIYFNIDKKSDSHRNSTENLEDANARAIWSLAVAASMDGKSSALAKLPTARFIIEKARDMMSKQRALILERATRSPRAIAFTIKALSLWLTISPDDEKPKARIIELAENLADLYRRSQNGEWHWFEENLTYSNGLLPEAMLLAFKATGNVEYKYIGIESLDFLIRYSFDGDMCVPVGQKGWFRLGVQKPLYDQQPEEVSALVLALQTASEIVGGASNLEHADPVAAYEPRSRDFYIEKKEQAFDWFLGNNILGQVVYSEMSGGCYDGLGEGYINLNQGAESTTAYLLARAVM